MAGTVLYVYYKVAVAEHAALLPHVKNFQSSLCAAWPGLRCELLQRPEATDGKETWMEIYQHASELTTAMIEAIATAAVTADLPAGRRSEIFVPLV